MTEVEYVLQWSWFGSDYWKYAEYESPSLDSVRVMRDAAMGYGHNRGKRFRIVKVTEEVVE